MKTRKRKYTALKELEAKIAASHWEKFISARKLKRWAKHPSKQGRPTQP